MVADIIVTVVAGVLLAVAVFGTVYPLLPGSPVALVTLIAWGWVLGSAASWTAAGIGAVLVCVGWSASALLDRAQAQARADPPTLDPRSGAGGHRGDVRDPSCSVFSSASPRGCS